MSASMMKHIILTLLALSLLASCDVEFSPNAEWKEIPVVYCVLDQDDDTTFVRVQKCYLGSGNLYQYSSEYDSVNYPEGALDVQILKYPATRVEGQWVATGATPERLQFDYALRYDKEEGNFAHPAQPIYQCHTAGRLSADAIYQLLIIKRTTGDTLAQSTTTLVSGETNPFYFVKPNKLNFLPSHKCDFRWNVLTDARLYQPKVRFFYLVKEQIEGSDSLRVVDTNHVDIYCARVRNVNNHDQLTTSLLESTFLLDVQNALKNDPSPKGFYDTCEVYLQACNEDLNAYINSTDADISGTQLPQMYTNIKNGIGIFASRRTHIVCTMPTDAAVGGERLHAQLKKLNVGFE